MVIEIGPEDEQIISERLRSGQFASVDELIHHAIATLPASEAAPRVSARRPHTRKSLAELFAESPFRGMAIDFDRFADTSSDL